jgi:hypothetical protein
MQNKSISIFVGSNNRIYLVALKCAIILFLLTSAFLSIPVNAEIGAATASSPYPPSPVVSGISFDWSTHIRMAPGSDNWPVTWASDDHQYTVWGDGGGFGGSNQDGRVSLGVARIEGSASSYQGVNVWGGKNPISPAEFPGKSYGIAAVDGSLYMWRCGDGSLAAAYRFQRLYRSTDRGQSWQETGVEYTQNSFSGSQGFYCPTFLQFGKDYQGARDGYVYMYAPELKSTSWDVQKPGEISLMRVPRSSLGSRSQYEYFAGMNSSGSPVWTGDMNGRRPVFQDQVNGVMTVSVSYNPGLGRYFLITEHTAGMKGNIGIYDALQPWGPWTTVLFESGFGTPSIDPTTFFWNFSNKWLSSDGRDFTMVFTGVSSNDSWNTVRGRFLTGSALQPPTPTRTPTVAFTATRTPTQAATASLTPTQALTPVPSSTQIASSTPAATLTSLATRTPTQVATASLTPTQAPTPTPSPTQIASSTPASTQAFTPTQPHDSLGVNVKVNFQRSTTEILGGYLADIGFAFGSRSDGYTYGWNIDNQANARERNASNSPDKAHDTFNHILKDGAAFEWEMELPNGDYLIRVVAGDSGFVDSVYKIEVEGVLTVDGVPTRSNPWIEGLSVVAVRDGRLTVVNGDGAINNKINFIEITSTAYFAPPATATPIQVTPQATNTPTPFASPTMPVTETAPDPQPTLNAEVDIKVNFQKQNSTIPEGFLADDGSTYMARSSGYTYGWNADNQTNTRERRSSVSPDMKYDTLNHMQRNGDFSWEIALPNGSYQIRVVAGDPGFYDSVYQIDVEGVLVVNGTPSNSSRWVEGEALVNVLDGRLSVSNGVSAQNNKISYLEIRSASPDSTIQPSVNSTEPAAPTRTPTPMPVPTQTPSAVPTSSPTVASDRLDIKINFQTVRSSTPAGFLEDDGSAFGERDNGYIYGWNLDNQSGARERNSSVSPDKQHDTLNHIPHQDMIWEIAVPNGSYQVRLVAGDPGFYDSYYKIEVEGVLVVNGIPNSSSRWVEGTARVDVQDGKLTLTHAPGAQNNKISFIEIISR